MLAFAERLGAEALATGHYARIDREAGRWRAAADPAKDQTYMLSRSIPAQLARLRFPLGDLTKPKVRELAAGRAARGRKPESQDLCFLAGTGAERFLARHGGPATRRGARRPAGGLGRHRGQHHFTVGQRKGWAWPPGSRSTCCQGRPPERRGRRPRDAARGPRGGRWSDAVLYRPGAQVDRVKLRYRRPAPRKVARRPLTLCRRDRIRAFGSAGSPTTMPSAWLWTRSPALDGRNRVNGHGTIGP